MELDLKNVKVKYSIKEVVLIATVLITGVTHMVRTEMEFTAVKKELAECQAKVEKFQKSTQSGIDTILKCRQTNAGPPCIPENEEKK